MRVITKKSVRAFLNRQPMRCANMRVYNEDGETRMLFHRNRIANMDVRGVISISTCGWNTRTTLDRLNGLLDQLRLGRAYCQQFQLHLDGVPWDGGWITIRPIDPARAFAVSEVKRVLAERRAKREAAAFGKEHAAAIARMAVRVASQCVHGNEAGTCKSEVCDGTY